MEAVSIFSSRGHFRPRVMSLDSADMRRKPLRVEWRAQTGKRTDIPGSRPQIGRPLVAAPAATSATCGHAQPPLPAILTGPARSSRIVSSHLMGGGCMTSALLGAGTGSPSCMLIAYTGIWDFSSAGTDEWSGFALDCGYPCWIEGPAAGAQTTGRSKLL